MAFLILLAGFGLWLTASSYAGLIAFTVVMGVGYGSLVAMLSAVAASIFSTEGLGELLGVLYTSLGVASLIGPPLAGALVDRTHNFTCMASPVAFVASFAALIAVTCRPLAPFAPQFCSRARQKRITAGRRQRHLRETFLE